MQAVWDRFLAKTEWPRARSIELAFENEVEKRHGLERWCNDIGGDFVYCDSPNMESGKCMLRFAAWSQCKNAERYVGLFLEIARMAAKLYREADGGLVTLTLEHLSSLSFTEADQRVLVILLRGDSPFLGGGSDWNWAVERFAAKLNGVGDAADYRLRVQRNREQDAAEHRSYLSLETPQPSRSANGRTFATAIRAYEVTGQLGEGGTGTVVSVRTDDGTELAIKLLDERKATTEKRKRFQNELGFGLRNRHPNIVTLVDYGLRVGADGQMSPFYVMPLYPATLRKKMRPGLTPAIAHEIALQLLNGVEAAHLIGTWHRDLKPENVLLLHDPLTVVIADWGCAHFAEEELQTVVETLPTTRLGNFQYAAPEQRKPGESVDHRADIFSLGLMINELFTEHVPQGEDYRRIAQVSAEHAYLDDVVSQMIQHDAARRFQTIDAVKQRIGLLSKVHASRQKLSVLEGMVVPHTAPDDVLVRDPIRVIGGDYDDGTLTIELNQAPTTHWVSAFQAINWQTAISGKDPISFRFSGRNARNSIGAAQAQELVDHFKRYVGLANTLYAARVAAELKKKEEQEREALRRAAEAESQRRHVLEELRF
jgi:serine/threonine protein kinase